MGIEDYLENFAKEQTVVKYEKKGKDLKDDLSIKEMIDELYWKEKKYIKQHLRDDFIGANDFIFNLSKTHHLKLSNQDT